MRGRLRLTARIFLGIGAALFALILFAVFFFAVAESVVDESAYHPPLRPKTDITELIGKAEWTEEDKEEPERILLYQEALYRDYVIGHEQVAFTTPRDILVGYRTEEGAEPKFSLVPFAPLEDGDVIVTSACHTFGWRNGHAAIVINAESGTVLECVGPGLKSSRGSASWFQYSSNFMVLRLKDKTAEERREIAVYAGTRLHGIDYSILTGFFGSPKDQGDTPKTSHCSHLVWQAFKHFGYDIDSDGGPVCTTRDIANCELFEVIQVFGFDQDKLWH